MQAGEPLFYIQSEDRPSTNMEKEEYINTRSEANPGNQARLMTVLPIYIGMEMVLGETYLPPNIVRGTAVKVVGVEPPPDEDLHSDQKQASLASHGCAILEKMPTCIYVRVPSCKQVFLQGGGGTALAGVSDMRGVVAVQPTQRQWTYATTMKNRVTVSRKQIPLFPEKQCTLHGCRARLRNLAA